MTRNIIVGPPGTGKTTRLLEVVEGCIEEGIRPNEICFVAFTRKAANEAKERAINKFQFSGEDLTWFRTLHSLAFQQMGVTRNRVMGIGDYIQLAQMLGLYITSRKVAEDGTMQGMSKGDRLFFMEMMARSTMSPLRDYWEARPNEDVLWPELERLANTVKEYKDVNDKVDFTDVIYDYIDNGSVPPIRVLIVDESQDLSPLQWKMIHKLEVVVEECYVAGDDDQAIFRWAGADVDHLMNLEGDREVLPQSYRVPRKIQEVANIVIQRCEHRIPKKWSPRDAEGKICYITQLSHLDLSQGQWLLLARNSYLLQQYNDHCIQMGFVFESALGSPVKGPVLQAVRLWESLRKGEKVTAAQARVVYDQISTSGGGVAHGYKVVLDGSPEDQLLSMEELRKNYGLRTDKVWHEALDRLPEKEREYFIAALKRGEKLLREPRIRITTIHGVKGGEADNVVVQCDMAQRSWTEFHLSPDDEHRVWYVAVTRARESLYILTPQTHRAYDL